MADPKTPDPLAEAWTQLGEALALTAAKLAGRGVATGLIDRVAEMAGTTRDAVAADPSAGVQAVRGAVEAAGRALADAASGEADRRERAQQAVAAFRERAQGDLDALIATATRAVREVAPDGVAAPDISPLREALAPIQAALTEATAELAARRAARAQAAAAPSAPSAPDAATAPPADDAPDDEPGAP